MNTTKMTKKAIMLSIVGMLAGLFICISAPESNTWFAVGFGILLGNICMFYLNLKKKARV